MSNVETAEQFLAAAKSMQGMSPDRFTPEEPMQLRAIRLQELKEREEAAKTSVDGYDHFRFEDPRRRMLEYMRGIDLAERTLEFLRTADFSPNEYVSPEFRPKIVEIANSLKIVDLDVPALLAPRFFEEILVRVTGSDCYLFIGKGDERLRLSFKSAHENPFAIGSMTVSYGCAKEDHEPTCSITFYKDGSVDLQKSYWEYDEVQDFDSMPGITEHRVPVNEDNLANILAIIRTPSKT